MNDQNPSVDGGEAPAPAAVAAPAPDAAPAKKRGRPRKPEGSVTVPKKAKRDVFAEAFGDKRAGVAVKVIRDKAERKNIVAAVKTFASSAKKRSDLEAKIKDVQAKIDKHAGKKAELEAELAGLNGAQALVESYKPRIASIIDTIYANVSKSIPVALPTAQAPASQI